MNKLMKTFLFLAITLLATALAEPKPTGFIVNTVKGYLEEGIGEPEKICLRYSFRKYPDCRSCCEAMFYEKFDEIEGKCICIQNETNTTQ